MHPYRASKSPFQLCMTVNVVALTEILETMSFALTLLMTGFQGGNYHDSRYKIPITFMHC